MEELLLDILKENRKQTELLKQIRDALFSTSEVRRAKKDAEISSLLTCFDEEEE